MKKKLVLMLLVLILGLTACDNTESVDTNAEQEKTENTGDVLAEDKDEPETEVEGTEEVAITIYYPDDMLEEVLTEVVECDELAEEIVWELLKEKEILRSECMINTFKQEGTSLELDVNEAFGEQLRSYGTAGESMMLHCVVNTFLDAYQCEQIMITENGEILCSGHAEYTDYFTRYE